MNNENNIKKSMTQTSTTAVLSDENMQKINKYTRRELKPEEIYCFNVILCDNEIDRDNERFTISALQKISEIFVGLTGIFDHNHKGENQTARIYDAWVETDSSRKTTENEVYHCVKASAYMVRNKSNQDLILEIDGGIKKEVSISCQVIKLMCSVCGVNRKEKSCSHVSGKKYNGKNCYIIMDEPIDAYEWSFVAIPAQRNAGVVKKFDAQSETEKNVTGKDESDLDEDAIVRLKQMAKWGEQYRDDLANEVIRLSFLTGNNFDGEILSGVVKKLDIDELKAFKSAFEEKATQTNPPVPVFGKNDFGNKIEHDLNKEFEVK